MKAYLIVGCFVIFFSTEFARSADSESATENAKLDNITSRVRAGDYNALSEAVTMPASIAIPYLQFWTAPRNGPQLAKAAGEALSNVNGFADYFRQDMTKIVSQGGIPGDDFIALGCIGTPEAAAVAAPYLFDARLITLNKGEPPDTIAGWAETELEQMDLPGAPKPSGDTPASVAIVEWQRWAIAKGFVPQDWISRVGAPAWMVRMEAVEKRLPGPFTNKSPQQSEPVSSPLPATSSSPLPSNTAPPTAALSAAETHAPDHTSAILISAVLAIIFIVGACTWKRRS